MIYRKSLNICFVNLHFFSTSTVTEKLATLFRGKLIPWVYRRPRIIHSTCRAEIDGARGWTDKVSIPTRLLQI